MPSTTGARAVFIVAGLLGGVQAQPGGPAPESWLYWIQVQDTYPYDTVILRAPLDDFTAIETVVDLPGGASGLAIDRSASKLWWAEPGKIQRADLDGSNIETVVTTPDVRFVAIDSSHHKVYWTSTQEVRRANMDGTAVEDVLVGLDGGPMGIKLDVAGGKLYFVEIGGYPHAVSRADLDGSNLEGLTGLYYYNPIGIALDVPKGLMFFTDVDQEGLYRAKMDGPSEPFNFGIGNGTLSFYDVALDVAAGMVYASELYFGNGIWRSDYGGGVEDEHVLPSGIVTSLAILAPYCGDGIVDPGEDCDDGNIVPSDGCAPDCNDPAAVPAMSIAGMLLAALLLSAASAARIRGRAETAELSPRSRG